MIGKEMRKFFTPAFGKVGRGFGVFFFLLLISFSLTGDIGGGVLSILLRGKRYDTGAQIETVLFYSLASLSHTPVIALLLYVSHRIVRFES